MLAPRDWPFLEVPLRMSFESKKNNIFFIIFSDRAFDFQFDFEGGFGCAPSLPLPAHSFDILFSLTRLGLG